MAARKLRRVTALHGEQGFVLCTKDVEPAAEDETVAGIIAEYDDVIVTATDIYVAQSRRRRTTRRR